MDKPKFIKEGCLLIILEDDFDFVEKVKTLI